MGVKNLKLEVATRLNYQFNQNLNIVYGYVDGYTNVFAPFDQYETTFNIIYCVSKEGNILNKDEFASLKTENKMITNIRVSNYRVICTIKSSTKFEDRVNTLIEMNNVILNYLKTNGYRNIDERSTQFGDTRVCNVRGEVGFVSAQTFEQIKAENNSDNGPIQKDENIGKGIIGGLLGSLVGVLAIVLIGQLGFIAVISGIAMAACTILGYSKLAGGISKKGVIIAIIIMLIMTYVGVRIDATITIQNELSKYYSGVDFMTVFGKVDDIVKLDTQIESAYIRDMILTYVFTAIGAAGIISTKFKEIGNKNVYEIF
ncbi:MAG: hypothetical protein J6I85_07925 [Clostridia bacterium]|nr:hypothetical protein [Clostridia bacterium]